MSSRYVSPRSDRVQPSGGKKERTPDSSCPSIRTLKSPSTEVEFTQLHAVLAHSRSNKPQADSAANPTRIGESKCNHNDAADRVVEAEEEERRSLPPRPLTLHDLSFIRESELVSSQNPSPSPSVSAHASSFNLSGDSSSICVHEAGPTPLTLHQLLALLPNRPPKRHENDVDHLTKASPTGEDNTDGDSISAAEEAEDYHEPKRPRRRDNRTTKDYEFSHLHGEELKLYETKREERLAHYQEVDTFKLHEEDVLWI